MFITKCARGVFVLTCCFMYHYYSFIVHCIYYFCFPLSSSTVTATSVSYLLLSLAKVTSVSKSLVNSILLILVNPSNYELISEYIYSLR